MWTQVSLLRKCLVCRQRTKKTATVQNDLKVSRSLFILENKSINLISKWCISQVSRTPEICTCPCELCTMTSHFHPLLGLVQRTHGDPYTNRPHCPGPMGEAIVCKQMHCWTGEKREADYWAYRHNPKGLTRKRYIWSSSSRVFEESSRTLYATLAENERCTCYCAGWHGWNPATLSKTICFLCVAEAPFRTGRTVRCPWLHVPDIAGHRQSDWGKLGKVNLQGFFAYNCL